MPTANNNTPEPGIKAQAAPNEIDSLKLLQHLFKAANKETLVKVLAAAGERKKRPSHWSSLTRAPYYAERFGLALKLVVDEMMKEYSEGKMEDREWKYEDYRQYTANTLYNRLNQSKKFLLDEMDIQGIYRAFFEGYVSFTREKSGIRLSFKRDLRHEDMDFLPSRVIPKEDVPKWKEEMDKFLQEAPTGATWYRKNISLDEDERKTLEDSLSNIKGIIFNIEDDRIKIIKVSIEQWEALQ